MIRNPSLFIGEAALGSTPGSIFFSGSTSLLAQDNANLFWDDANNRLGVGINSSLVAKLDAKIGATTETGLRIQGIASQTADMIAVLDSGAANRWNLSKYGKVIVHNDSFAFSGTIDENNAIEVKSNISGVGGAATFSTINVHPSYSFNTALSFGFLGTAAGITSNPAFVKDASLGAGTDAGTWVGVVANPSYVAASRTITEIRGVSALPIVGASSTATLIAAFFGGVFNGGAITTFRTFMADSFFLSAFTKPTNYSAVWIGDPGAGITTAVGVHQLGTNLHNRFVGDVSIGQDAAPGGKLEVKATATTQIGVLVGSFAAQTADAVQITGLSTNIALRVLGSTSTARIQPNLRVGADTAPNVALDVTGWVNVTGDVRVTSQFNKTNTVFANVTGLSVTITTGRTYQFEARLYYASDPAGGHKFQMAGTATASNVIYQVMAGQTGANFALNQQQTALAPGATGNSAGTGGCCLICGTISCNGTGTLTVQFAQNTASGTSSILVGSTLRVWDIA